MIAFTATLNQSKGLFLYANTCGYLPNRHSRRSRAGVHASRKIGIILLSNLGRTVRSMGISRRKVPENLPCTEPVHRLRRCRRERGRDRWYRKTARDQASWIFCILHVQELMNRSRSGWRAGRLLPRAARDSPELRRTVRMAVLAYEREGTWTLVGPVTPIVYIAGLWAFPLSASAKVLWCRPTLR